MLKTDEYFLSPWYLFQASEHSIIGGCFVKFCVIINGITTLDVEKNSRMVQYIRQKTETCVCSLFAVLMLAT